MSAAPGAEGGVGPRDGGLARDVCVSLSDVSVSLTDRVPVPALLFPAVCPGAGDCSLSVPQFPHLYKGHDKSTRVRGLM